MNNFHFENDKNLYLNPFTRIPFEEFLQFLILFKNTIEYLILTSLIALTRSQLYKYNVDIRKKKERNFSHQQTRIKHFQEIFILLLSLFSRERNPIFDKRKTDLEKERKTCVKKRKGVKMYAIYKYDLDAAKRVANGIFERLRNGTLI